MPFDLVSAITGAVEGLGGAVAKVIDSANAPKAMKEQMQAAVDAVLAKHQSELLSAQIEIEKMHEAEKEALLADVQSARSANANIQQAEKASWLAKNIPYCLAIFMTVIWGTCTIYILFRMLGLVEIDPKADMTAIMAMYTGISGLYAGILSFYFGSTHSSKDKDATIASLSANQVTT